MVTLFCLRSLFVKNVLQLKCNKVTLSYLHHCSVWWMQNFSVSREKVFQTTNIILLNTIEVHDDVLLLAGNGESRDGVGAFLALPLCFLGQVQRILGNDSTWAWAQHSWGKGVEFSGVFAPHTLTTEMFALEKSNPSYGCTVECPKMIYEFKSGSNTSWLLRFLVLIL